MHILFRIEGNQFEPYFLNGSTTSFPPLPSADKNVSHTPKIPKVNNNVFHQYPHKKHNVALAIIAAALCSIFITTAISLAVYFLARRARKKDEIINSMFSPPISEQLGNF